MAVVMGWPLLHFSLPFPGLRPTSKKRKTINKSTNRNYCGPSTLRCTCWMRSDVEEKVDVSKACVYSESDVRVCIAIFKKKICDRTFDFRSICLTRFWSLKELEGSPLPWYTIAGETVWMWLWKVFIAKKTNHFPSRLKNTNRLVGSFWAIPWPWTALFFFFFFFFLLLCG